MDITLERSDGATIGTLFQHIINDMKNSSPLWEDFIAKATKLHACLRAAIQALAAYLDAFQKIADAATNSRGATKEIGTALTRVCLRHKAVETRMKTFTSAIMECLIIPLQDRLEDWKKQVAIIDKDHAKEYKRCRAELKKRSSDTLRLQKKAKKGQADNLHVLVESSMQDVTLRRCELEEVERKSLRSAMVEERTRYCTFVNFLQPVVKEECEVMSELGHLQEAMQLIAVVTKDPTILPQASEELILESKTNMNLYPDSPGGSNSQACSNSLGSRKSSVCSISSMNSSSSGSPGHQFQRSLSQYSPAIRLKPGESSDSGFCSSPALTSQASTAASQSHAVSTWPPHTQDGVPTADRPHTISSAYEKGHQRPALTVYTFQNPETIAENQKSPANILCRPPLPVRCSSLERPLSATATVKTPNASTPRQCPSPIPAHITKEHPQLQPTYVNMLELASMAASKITNNNNNNNNISQQPIYQQIQQIQQPSSPVLSTASSLISPDSTATNPVSSVSSPDASAGSTQTPQNTPQTSTPQTPIIGSGSGGGDGSNQESSESINDKTLSPENTDIIKCTGSVLEKTSLFEKLEQQQINNNLLLQQPPTRIESVYGRKNEEIYKSTGLLSEKDSGAARVARRASVNTIKPPPPVRRSSSVTPSHNLGTNSPNLSQQSLVYTSSESLPPPPAYLLDSTSGSSPSRNVAGTVKALNEIRHMPASPSVLRRAQQNQHQQQHQSNLQYTTAFSTPKSDTSVSSMYTPQSPNSFSSNNDSFNMSSRSSKSSHHQQGPQKQSSGFLAQLNARIAPNKNQQQQQQSSPQYSQQNIYGHTTAPSSNSEQIYQRSNNTTVDQRQYNNHQQQQQPQQTYSSSPRQHEQQYFQPQQHHQKEDYQSKSTSSSNNVLSKSSVGFLENLNARLAEQRLSGKAFAVRNLINSKALPDPRICHESLMDQIKRGATLKRNRTINDRSAPKIH